VAGASVYCCCIGEENNGAKLQLEAKRIAQKIAAWFWENRHLFHPGKGWSAKQALEYVSRMVRHRDCGDADSAVKSLPFVINESHDNTGAGAPGDSTHVLGEVLAAAGRGYLGRDVRKIVMGPFWDSVAVKQIFTTASATLEDSLFVGGRYSPEILGQPVQLCGIGSGDDDFDGKKTGAVRVLETLPAAQATGRWTGPMEHGCTFYLGDSALVELTLQGPESSDERVLHLLLTSERVQPYDDAAFKVFGMDVTEYDLVCVKSMVHFRAGFSQLAFVIVPVDCPGLSSCNLSNDGGLKRESDLKAGRKMWPEAEDAQWAPK